MLKAKARQNRMCSVPDGVFRADCDLFHYTLQMQHNVAQNVCVSAQICSFHLHFTSKQDKTVRLHNIITDCTSLSLSLFLNDSLHICVSCPVAVGMTPEAPRDAPSPLVCVYHEIRLSFSV